jgi:hypothetical protein
MQQQELQIKGQDVQRKAEKDKADIALENRRLDLEEQRMHINAELDANKMGAKIAYDKDKLDRESEMKATKMGIDMAHDKQLVKVDVAKEKAKMLTEVAKAEMSNKRASE